MLINSIFNSNIASLKSLDIDLLVCANGYEKRAVTISRALKDLNCKRIAISFTEHKEDGNRPKNEEIFDSLGFKKYPMSGNSIDEVESLITRCFDELNKNKVNVVIDISSMTRNWYAAIIKAISKNTRIRQVVVYFAYVPSVFVPQKDPYPPNQIISPVKGYAGLMMADKPLALVIGLGDDEGRAFGLKDTLDPMKTYVFYPNLGYNKKYCSKVLSVNKGLIDKLPQENKFEYSVTDPISAFVYLESFCSQLLPEYRVVLASLGHKIFGLCCFLLSIKHPDISVWRVSAGTRSNVVNYHPGRSRVIVGVEFLKGNKK